MNWWQKYRFTFNFLAIAVLLEVLWFFVTVTWILIEKYVLAGFLMTLALPAAGAIYLLLPAEKRDRCTAADLKILNLISRIAFGITALFGAFVLSGMHLHLPNVLPVPVGPAKKRTPFGLLCDECCNPDMPVIARFTTSKVLVIAPS